MKKAILFAMTIATFVSCKKEMTTQITGEMPIESISFKEGEELPYEELEFENNQDAVNSIVLSLTRLNNTAELGSCSIENAVFLLEGGINLLYPDEFLEGNEKVQDSNYYELDMANNLVSELDLREAIADLHEKILSTSSATVAHIATDVKVFEVTDTKLKLVTFSYYVAGTTGIVFQLGGPCTIVTDAYNRWVGQPYECGPSVNNVGWAVTNMRKGAEI